MKEPEYKGLVIECAKREQGIMVSEQEKGQNRNLFKKK